MDNKYQEALDSLAKKYEDMAINKLHETGWHLEDLKEYWTLQELIDEHEKLKSELEALKIENIELFEEHTTDDVYVNMGLDTRPVIEQLNEVFDLERYKK